MAGWVSLWIVGLNYYLTHWASVPPSNNFSSLGQIAVCDLIVDAGPDLTICELGIVELNGSVTGDLFFLEWIPGTGLNNPAILNPEADISETITYTLIGWGLDPDNPNIVVNGDFESGNSTFSSDYVYVTDEPGTQEEMVPGGTYTVLNDPTLVHAAWSPCPDHTSGNGDMMIINGAYDLQDVWCQDIDVDPDTWYNVAAWVSSVHPSAPAILQFSINGSTIGSIVNAPATPCEWVPFNAIWHSGSSTTASLCILNQNTEVFGNDFALDDISMVELCYVEDEVTITLTEESFIPVINGPEVVCIEDINTYSIDLPAELEVTSLFWTVSAGGNILNGQNNETVTVEWEDGGDQTVCINVETPCGIYDACFDIVVNDSPAPFSISGPDVMCPGSTATFTTPDLDPENQYDWFLPPELNLISGAGTNEIEVEWNGEGEVQVCLTVSNECGSADNCVDVTLSGESVTLFDTTLCTGSTIVINGTVYGNGNWSGSEIFFNANGCDSIVEVSITEAESLEFIVSENLCSGDSLFVAGDIQTETGIYRDSFMTTSGCDSIVITNLFFSDPDTTFLSLSSCFPADTGVTSQIFSNLAGCDSLVITQTHLLSLDTTLLYDTTCDPLLVGVASQLLINIDGCDSLVITETVLMPSDTILLFDNSCDPSLTGVTTESFLNSNGCDSTVITTIFFSLSDTTLIESTTCVISDTGTTTVLFVNSEGCDSLVIQTIIYGGTDTVYLFQQTCSSQDSGLVINEYVNQFGCDSVIIINTFFVASDTTYLNAFTCDPLEIGVVTQDFVNSGGCDSTVIVTTILSLQDECFIDALFTIHQPKCFGDTGWLVTDIITGLGPFQLSWEIPGNTGNAEFVSSGQYILPFEFGGPLYVLLESANGLTIADTLLIDRPDPLLIDANVVEDYNGFGIPCYGDTIGEAQVEVISQGTPPLIFEWSTGSNEQFVSNLKAGEYIITVTDRNDCITSDTILITQPDSILYELVFEDIPCFGLNNGSITISILTGGITPWEVSIDDGPFQSGLQFENLEPGLHQLVITDQNECEINEEFQITEPAFWSVELGNDTTVAYGSDIVLTPIISGVLPGETTIEWSDEKCENCATRMIEATANTTYEVVVTDENGCVSTDRIVIRVVFERDLYIPNVFSPNDDGTNNHFTIFSSSLEEIEELSIFDRWGNLVFQKFNFPSNEPVLGWNGRFDDKPLNPGVFAFKAIVLFKDGERQIKHGDVTLVR